jgi:membrane-associated phospholipid phosphatase
MEAKLAIGSVRVASAATMDVGRRLSLFALACCLAGAALLPVDLVASTWMRSHPAGDGAAKLFEIGELFAHGAGAALLLIAAALLDPASRRRLPRVAAIAFGAGLAANIGKLAIARWRPRAFPGDGSVAETFQNWLPWLGGASGEESVRWGSHLQSFPSSHTATGIGLALALAWLYPRGRWLFFALAALAALQRVDGGAHYPSDVCFGAAIGFAAAAILLGDNRLSRRFAQFELA